MAAARQTRPEPPEIMPRKLARRGACNGDHVKPARVERIGKAADVAALSGRVPALVADDDGDTLAINLIVERCELFLQTPQFFFILLRRYAPCEIRVAERRCAEQREIVLPRPADIAAVLECAVDGLRNGLKARQQTLFPVSGVENVPFAADGRFLHKLAVGTAEGLVFLVLPEIVARYAPLGIDILAQLRDARELFLARNMQKELHNDISVVAQLPLKDVARIHAALVFLRGDLPAQVFIDAVFHPAGVHKKELAVFRQRLEELPEERIALLVFRHALIDGHAIKARVHLADKLVDEMTLSRAVPALHKNDHGQFCRHDALLLRRELFAEPVDFRLAPGFIESVVRRFKIVKHIFAPPKEEFRFFLGYHTALYLSKPAGFFPSQNGLPAARPRGDRLNAWIIPLFPPLPRSAPPLSRRRDSRAPSGAGRRGIA